MPPCLRKEGNRRTPDESCWTRVNRCSPFEDDERRDFAHDVGHKQRPQEVRYGHEGAVGYGDPRMDVAIPDLEKPQNVYLICERKRHLMIASFSVKPLLAVRVLQNRGHSFLSLKLVPAPDTQKLLHCTFPSFVILALTRYQGCT